MNEITITLETIKYSDEYAIVFSKKNGECITLRCENMNSIALFFAKCSLNMDKTEKLVKFI